MSTVDPAWQEWAEKAAAEYSRKLTQNGWAQKCEAEARRLGECQASAILHEACEQFATDHIQGHRRHEHARLVQRLADPESQTEPLLPALATLWMLHPEQEGGCGDLPTDEIIPMLATALLDIRDQLLDSQECQEMDEAGAILHQRVEQLAREHGPHIRRTFDKQAVLDALEDGNGGIGSLLVKLCHCFADFADHMRCVHPDLTDDARAKQQTVDALFALIDALPKSTARQAGGAE